MQGLINMLASGNVKASDYLMANPFSTLANEDLDGYMKKNIFFEKLYVMTYEHVLRCAQLLDAAEDSSQNTLFLTGFRGSGKTTFANFLASLVNGEIKMPPCTKEVVATVSTRRLLDIYNELAKIFIKKLDTIPDKQYTEELSENDIFEIINQTNIYIDYINNILQGKAIYLNFESGVTEPECPFEQKLNSNLKKLIARIINEGANKAVFSTVTKISALFGLTTFESKDNYCVKEFLDFAKSKLTYSINSESVKYDVNNALAKLNTDQLLSLIVLIDLSYLEYKESSDRIFYLFDNIDVIFDTRILNNFIQRYVYFARNMSDLMEKVTKSKLLRRSSSFHRDFCFIFVMRETSTMLISDHFNDRLLKLSTHVDISSDMDHSAVIHKKRLFLEDIDENEPSKSRRMKALLHTVSNVDDLCIEPYIKANIFPMFNNDYKRAIPCLASICQDNIPMIKQFFALNTGESDYAKHGARGIIFRLIFDHFHEKMYFQRLGVAARNKDKFTVARIILLYLNASQYNHCDSFIFDDRDRVSLKTLYTDLKNILSDNEKQSADMFFNSLVEMFKLRTAGTWSHLITFDSVKSVTLDDVRPAIYSNRHEANSENISVRITCTGRNYVRFIAPHFEFFSCRFVDSSSPLFSEACLKFDSDSKEYEFERVIRGVYLAMERCCKKLYQFEHDKLITGLSLSREDLLETPEFLYVDKAKKYSILHEERYIHQHIRYIDAYRMFLINGKRKDDVININKRIIKHLSNYVGLLSKNPYYSDISSHILATELKACIDFIENNNYRSTAIEVSRAGYKALGEQGKCK